MRLPLAVLPWFAFVAVALAQPHESPVDAGPASGSTRDIALDNLLSERDSPNQLDVAIATARKNGISEQAILEARFLYHVDRREDDAIAAMLPEFLKQAENFKLGDSAIFSVKEDWLAVIEYVQAIASLKKGDKDAFKTHITEAFWLSPRQASAFAPHIDRMRLEDAMRSVKIDFEAKFIPLAGGDSVTLKSLIADKKAMIFHFWSPASRECESSLPDYAATAKALGEKGIAMISIMPGDSPEILTKARAMVLSPDKTLPGAWLLDSKETPLARTLRVQTLPVFALVSSSGNILFNGDPTDESFWEALKKLDPKIIRPQSPGGAD